MNGSTSVDRNSRLEAFVPELTLTAYRVALQAGTRGTWADLQLGLWKALAEKVVAWERDTRPQPAVLG